MSNFFLNSTLVFRQLNSHVCEKVCMSHSEEEFMGLFTVIHNSRTFCRGPFSVFAEIRRTNQICVHMDPHIEYTIMFK